MCHIHRRITNLRPAEQLSKILLKIKYIRDADTQILGIISSSGGKTIIYANKYKHLKNRESTHRHKSIEKQ